MRGEEVHTLHINLVMHSYLFLVLDKTLLSLHHTAQTLMLEDPDLHDVIVDFEADRFLYMKQLCLLSNLFLDFSKYYI
jgi:hypothetical protein